MNQINELRNRLPDAGNDTKLNLESVLTPDKLDAEQTWGVALASAYFLKDAALTDAVFADAQAAGLSEAAIDDAKAAAILMSMTTIYYRFRHMADNEAFAKIPPRLRMSRMAKPATNKANFELFSMACAALEGCEMCINAHETTMKQHDLTDDQVHDCVRIAAVINALSTGLAIGSND